MERAVVRAATTSRPGSYRWPGLVAIELGGKRGARLQRARARTAWRRRSSGAPPGGHPERARVAALGARARRGGAGRGPRAASRRWRQVESLERGRYEEAALTAAELARTAGEVQEAQGRGRCAREGAVHRRARGARRRRSARPARGGRRAGGRAPEPAGGCAAVVALGDDSLAALALTRRPEIGRVLAEYAVAEADVRLAGGAAVSRSRARPRVHLGPGRASLDARARAARPARLPRPRGPIEEAEAGRRAGRRRGSPRCRMRCWRSSARARRRCRGASLGARRGRLAGGRRRSGPRRSRGPPTIGARPRGSIARGRARAGARAAGRSAWRPSAARARRQPRLEAARRRNGRGAERDRGPIRVGRPDGGVAEMTRCAACGPSSLVARRGGARLVAALSASTAARRRPRSRSARRRSWRRVGSPPDDGVALGDARLGRARRIGLTVGPRCAPPAGRRRSGCRRRWWPERSGRRRFARRCRGRLTVADGAHWPGLGRAGRGRRPRSPTCPTRARWRCRSRAR